MRKALVNVIVPFLFLSLVSYIIYYSLVLLKFDEKKLEYTLDSNKLPVVNTVQSVSQIKRIYKDIKSKTSNIKLPYSVFGINLHGLTKKELPGFKYPVRLIGLNKVQVFCLETGLKKYNFRYILLKDDRAVNLVLYFKDKNKLVKLANYLREYDIKLPK